MQSLSSPPQIDILLFVPKGIQNFLTIPNKREGSDHISSGGMISSDFLFFLGTIPIFVWFPV